ncbi:dihydrolipoamide succinyltransferase [Croceibacterium mercuriale]|uniref:Dihydrolipoyllysine-residue succinyltransferase component of 2-oxoglutarate dehydrogenase complex n=1 Tax=Croceibacterium mercuriale TaxID=1572751 RepID=A0A0B2BXK8_9SPHN|nr:2-oxoglutarate dehydrogenase complex dihydrolipoyllysine-residue succinyltransferase [Croceibacterium mercuriale]KHL26333.1 dihydrolipoamide succinyltransferase [Croceibacterium mercuriale]
MAIEVKVPVLGESVAEATIGEWLKKPGEAVAADEPIASLETDKVAVEVPSPVAGFMGDYLVQVGDTVEVGAAIATINDQGGASSGAASAPAAFAPAPAAAPAPATAPAAGNGDVAGDQSLSPSVRRAVLEHGIDPASVKGTGKDGRLTKEDVVAAAQAKKDTPGASTSAPAVAAAPASSGGGERLEERVKMTRLRQTIAKRLKSAQETAALLTTFNDVDMSAVIAAREAYKDVFAKKHNIKLGFMSFFAKAACLALKDVPAVNARMEGDEIIYHKYVDLSVAVSAPNGLVVPVVRNVESMSFAEIEQAIAGFGKKAKEGALTMADMSGGTFTISNGGVFGSLMSTPIINPPQSAVLGLHRIDERPVAVNGQVVIRPMMYMALSYDHRIIDGREAVTALKIMKDAIEDPMRLLIDL